MASKVESKSTHICSSLRNKRKRKLSKKKLIFFLVFFLGKRVYSVVNRINYRLWSKAIPLSCHCLNLPTSSGYLMSNELGIIKWVESYFHHFLITLLHPFLLFSFIIESNQHSHLKSPSLLSSYASACSSGPFERIRNRIRGSGSNRFWTSLPLRLKCATSKTRLHLKDWCWWYSINWLLTDVERYQPLTNRARGRTGEY